MDDSATAEYLNLRRCPTKFVPWLIIAGELGMTVRQLEYWRKKNDWVDKYPPSREVKRLESLKARLMGKRLFSICLVIFLKILNLLRKLGVINQVSCQEVVKICFQATDEAAKFKCLMCKQIYKLHKVSGPSNFMRHF